MNGEGAREVKLESGVRIELTSLRTRRRVWCTIGQLLAVGGTAKVYSGRTDDGHEVVLKAQRFQGQVDPSFELEVELFKKLFHRNIVHCVGVANTLGGYLVLGFRRAYQNPLLLLTKASVARRDRRATYPSLSIDTAIDFAYELLNGLDYLERLGFVHHDVKLANILVDVAPREGPLTGGEVFGEVVRRSYRGVLIDFGATRSRAYLEAWNRGEAPEGLAPLITPIYAPPEALVESRQADGKLRVIFDPSLDVYAAALVLYALVTGHPPYSHLRINLDLNDVEDVITVKSAERRAELQAISLEVIQRAVFEDARFVTGDRASFDLAFHRFLAQRLHPDPKERGSAADMKRDFEKLACIRQLRDEPAPGGPRFEGGAGTGGRAVFLPFEQQLVVVGGKGGEHPLLRAARSFGMGPESERQSPEPATPLPAGDPGSTDEGSRTPSRPREETKVDADANWLDEMDATDGLVEPDRSGSSSGTGSGIGPVEGAKSARSTRRHAPGRPPAPGDGGPRPQAEPQTPRSARGEPGTARRGGPPAGRPKGESGVRKGPPPAAPPRSDRPPPPPGAGRAAHCLISSALPEPVLLSRERRYVVGRDPDVEMRIRSDMISRRHAEFAWTGAHFQVSDLGSLNGTYLNGERLEGSAPLHDGDVVTVGGFEILVKTLQSGQKPPEPPPGPRPAKSSSQETRGPATTTFTGDLAKLGMRELVHTIQVKKHSGTLLIVPPEGPSGKIYWRQGLLHHAELGRLPPREAAVRLFSLRSGKYTFVGGEPKHARTLEEPVAALWAEVAPDPPPDRV